MSLERGLAFVLKREGGFSDNPKDRGGATNYGVTQAAYDSWRYTKGKLPIPVKLIMQDEVRQIYEDCYWKSAHCDSIPEPLDLAVFDTAVNMGVGYAIKTLQACLGIAADGVWGPKTLLAVQKMDAEGVLEEYLNRRRDRYEEIVEKDPSQAGFLRGWLARVDLLEKEVT